MKGNAIVSGSDASDARLPDQLPTGAISGIVECAPRVYLQARIIRKHTPHGRDTARSLEACAGASASARGQLIKLNQSCEVMASAGRRRRPLFVRIKRCQVEMEINIFPERGSHGRRAIIRDFRAPSATRRAMPRRASSATEIPARRDLRGFFSAERLPRTYLRRVRHGVVGTRGRAGSVEVARAHPLHTRRAEGREDLVFAPGRRHYFLGR